MTAAVRKRKAVILCLLLIGCSRTSAVADGDVASANPNLPLEEIFLPEGSVILAEVAREKEDRRRGLQGRTALLEGRGMLFVMPHEGQHVFWMQGMLIDIDVLFLDGDKKVAAVFHAVEAPKGAQGYEAIPRVRAQGRYVLELRAGAARAMGLEVGDALEFGTVDYPEE